jgi:DNA-binding CsgD family transcriptional regulator
MKSRYDAVRQLTPHQVRVGRTIVREELTNQEAADRFVVTTKAIDKLLTEVYDILGCRGRVGMTRHFIENGLLDE